MAGNGAGDLGGTLDFATAATASSGVGGYDVTPEGLTSGNYDISYVTGSLDVTKRAATITADANPDTDAVDAFTKVYGSDNPTFQVRYDGFVAQDAASLGGTLTWPDGSPVDYFQVDVYKAAGDDTWQLETSREVVSWSSGLGVGEFAIALPAGNYRAVFVNYDGGATDDWTSAGVAFANPLPELRTGTKEAWTLTCSRPNGVVGATRAVVVDRGQTLDLGNACKQAKED